MKKYLAAMTGAIFICLSLIGPTQAHSLKYVEKQLAAEGNYFRYFDRKAPVFELQDSEGNKVASDSFDGKIIILFFIRSGCLKSCSTHIETMAEIQSMVNISPMRELVRFVAIVTDSNKDTHDLIHKSVAKLEIDTSNWVFLTAGSGRTNAMQRLKQAFERKFSSAENNSQATKMVTHVIDNKGRWRADFSGPDYQPIDFVLYINALINFGNGVKDGHTE